MAMSSYFLYWDAVGYVTRPVHSLTLSRGGRADSVFGATQDEQTQTLFASQFKSCTNVMRTTDSVTKVI